jgi:glycerol kinase
MSKYVGAIDQGTTSSRFMVFDQQGAVVAVAQREHQQIYPKPGWVEHDAAEIWRNTEAVVGEALARGGVRPGELAAVGITNQRETTVLWDRNTGAPLHNALVWQDTRTADFVAAYARDGGQDRFRARTGLPLATYFSGLKLKWLLDNVPGARAKASTGDLLFGTIDTWLLWNLTGGPAGGVHVTDVTNASRTQLAGLDTLDWDDELLAAFDIPRAVLPRVAPSSASYGAAQIAALRGVPISGILGDQQAALVGQTCFEPGEAKNTYGTGCFMLMNTGGQIVPSTAGLVTTVAYQLGDEPPCYALEGSIAIAGALVQWLRDNLGLIAKSSEIEALARQVEDNGDVYIVPAFSGLFAPYWRDTARGAITGLTRYANRAHIARAALEAVAYQTRDVLEAMEKDSGIPIKELRVDGGMVANELLMQFQADQLGVPVVRPRVTETTALGAAYAAGLAVGYWASRAELVRNWGVERRWQPAMAEPLRAKLYAAWQKAVRRSFDWVDRPG